VAAAHDCIGLVLLHLLVGQDEFIGRIVAHNGTNAPRR
jgi:hypothetical protein